MSKDFYKLASLLIQYPNADLLSELTEIGKMAEKLPSAQRKPVLEFIGYLEGASLTELQQKYVETFDFNKRTCLNLSFHNYGDRRQRGMAMLQLKRRYTSAGLPLKDGELPDYLPVVLEFAALASGKFGQEVLHEFRPSLELVRSALHEDESPYASLLKAILRTLPRLSVLDKAAVRRLAEEGPPTEMVGQEPFAPPETMPVETAAHGGTP